MSFLLSFTSGIPDCRPHDVWKNEYSLSPNQGNVSPPRMNHGGWQTRLGSTGGRGYYYLAAKLTYFIRRA